MKKIDKKVIEKIAKLSSLNFSEKEIELYSNRFASVIQHFEKLKDIDTMDVEPTSQTLKSDFQNLRDDDPYKFDDIEGIMENAPAKDNRYYRVPKVI